MNKKLTQNERQEWARGLYISGSTIKETATKVKVEEAAIRQWAAQGSWDAVRRSTLISKTAQLDRLYSAVEVLSARMEGEEGTSLKDIDLMLKYTAAIKNLDTEYSTYTTIEVAEQFLSWLQKSDLAVAQLFTRHFDVYIKERMQGQ